METEERLEVVPEDDEEVFDLRDLKAAESEGILIDWWRSVEVVMVVVILVVVVRL